MTQRDLRFTPTEGHNPFLTDFDRPYLDSFRLEFNDGVILSFKF